MGLSTELKPSMAEIMHPDTRMLNVRSPWAGQIIDGLKDVENRPNELKMDPDAWVLLVNSGNQSSRKDVDRMNRIRKTIGKDPVRRPVDHKQCIIGMVKFQGSFTGTAMGESGLQTPWYNGEPDKAWVVKHYWKLQHPIPRVPGSLSLRKLHNLNKTDPGLYDRILEQLEAQI